MLQPLRRRNLCERIVEEVKAYIAENSLMPGDRLPTENELGEKLGVSRASVREAMKALETMGIVSTRPRIGCVVMSFDMKTLARHLSFRFRAESADLQELLEARLLLETAILPLVVERATEEHFAKMEESIRLLEMDIEQGGNGVPADVLFHEALVEAAGNKVLQGFADVVKEFFTELRRKRLADRERGMTTIREHTAIYRAIRDRDAERAANEMRKHLEWYVTDQVISSNEPLKRTTGNLQVLQR